MGTRPAIFKWLQTEPGLILCAVRWYLRYSLSLRDVEELLEERGLDVDHTTVWRWVSLEGEGMSSGDENRAALVLSQSAALSCSGATSLARRGLARAEALLGSSAQASRAFSEDFRYFR
jgi:hypothetical protein